MPPEPTPEQVVFFRKYELALSPSRSAAQSLMNFIISGVSTEYDTPDKRVALVRQEQEKWNDKPVAHILEKRGDTEVVQYILARSPQEMRHARATQVIRRRQGMDAGEPSFFKAGIKRRGSFVTIGLENLSLVAVPRSDATVVP